MKTLGIKQFHQKQFKLLDLSKSKFKGVLGDVPRHFICVIYGYSGNGKTESCMQLAKELASFGKVAWLSYEQRHGYDLQQATKRNNMEECSGNFLVIDPVHSLKAGVSFLEDLDNYLKKRNSPEYIFFDSLDYTGFKIDDYLHLKNKYEGKKTFIFISHSDKSGRLKKTISEQILFDGGMGLWVKDFIMRPVKNRFGGFEPYIVYEKGARERDPLFFAKQVKEKKSSKQMGLFEKQASSDEGKMQKNGHEARGVDAKILIETEG